MGRTKDAGAKMAGGIGSMLTGLLGSLGGGGGGGDTGGGGGGAAASSGGGGAAPPRGGYQNLATGASDASVIGGDLLKEVSGQGTGPSDDNFIRNLFGTLLGDPGSAGPIATSPAEEARLAAAGVQPGRPRRSGVLGGMIGGVFQALMGGTMGFIQNRGIEAVVNGLTAAGAAGPTPMAIVTGIMSFLGSGGAGAIAGAADKGLGGFRKGGGMAATQTLAHEVSGNVGQLGDKLTNGALGLMLGGQNERPASAPKPRTGGGGGGDEAANDADTAGAAGGDEREKLMEQLGSLTEIAKLRGLDLGSIMTGEGAGGAEGAAAGAVAGGAGAGAATAPAAPDMSALLTSIATAA